MYEDIYYHPSYNGWNKTKTIHSDRWQARKKEHGFTCQHCGAYVYTLPGIAGVQSRNHCPFCLWSRHLDHMEAGDRMSACKASMQPIGLTVKHRRNKYASYNHGELMVIHRCSNCGKFSINRIAADDLTDVLLGIYHASQNLDEATLNNLDHAGIHPLLAQDECIVTGQLYGLFQRE